MSDRANVCRSTANKLRSFASRSREFPILTGFDGFVDSIIEVVDQRDDAEHYVPIDTIERFGQKILEAAGQSSNYELVVKREKLGGNGPIMANALALLGFPVSYIGALGLPHVHPVFSDFVARAECISIANPGLTDALEFDDGKLMLGKHQSIKQVDWQSLCKYVGEERFRELVDQSRLLGMVNWTMLLNVEEIWHRLAEEILPGLPKPSSGRRRVFIDLADPEKRPVEDLISALRMLTRLQQYADVVLGLNLKEAEQVSEALAVRITEDPSQNTESMARGIRSTLGILGVVIHPRSFATVSWAGSESEQVARFSGPRIDDPQILTGGGDHFNAGFCLGWLAGLDVEELVCAGVATSGFYVGKGATPTLDELIEFIASVPEPAI